MGATIQVMTNEATDNDKQHYRLFKIEQKLDTLERHLLELDSKLTITLESLLAPQDDDLAVEAHLDEHYERYPTEWDNTKSSKKPAYTRQNGGYLNPRNE